MDYTKLGTTGLDVSRLCLGSMTFGIPSRGNRLHTRRGNQPPRPTGSRQRGDLLF